MELTQTIIDHAIQCYNEVTKAHKRPPVVAFVTKRLEVGEEVALSSGQKRWSSALVFTGTPENLKLEFRINPALPASFQEMLKKQQKQFLELFTHDN